MDELQHISKFDLQQLLRKDKERLEKATNEIKCKAKSIVCDLSKEKEVRSLMEKGALKEDPGMQAIGYREFFIVAQKHNVPPKNAPLDEVTAMIQLDSRKYAKRQMTFFKSLDCVKWLKADDFESFQKEVSGFYSRFF